MTPPLISVEEANECAASAIFLDCRFSLADFTLGRSLYRDGHIPCAYHMDMENDLSGPKGSYGGRHPIPSNETFTYKLRRCGVDKDSLVIVYCDLRLAGAARCWWLLNYFGHNNVRVLDGGYRAWRAISLPESIETPPERNGNFIARANKELIVDMDFVRTLKDHPESPLIDSREAVRYQGKEEPIDKVAGRIPGAVSQPWQNVTHEDGHAKTPKQQARLWRGIGDGHKPIIYCGSGITASVNALSMVLAGYPMPRLYAGSYSDWISYSDNPIEKDI